jgi:hypothetical protein
MLKKIVDVFGVPVHVYLKSDDDDNDKGIMVADIKLCYNEICRELGFYPIKPRKFLDNMLKLAMGVCSEDLKKTSGDIDKMKDLDWYIVNEILSLENASEFS